MFLLALLTACGRSGSDSVDDEPAPRHAGDTEEAIELRNAMVDAIESDGYVKSPRVLEVLREVPRHLFAPRVRLSSIYLHDLAQPIGHHQTISSPEIVAMMTAALELDGTERVLEIGTGSGYQAAVLSGLAREVFTIEIVPELGREARARLAALGYDNVHVRIGDGYLGWPEMAPFDAIIVTAAPPETPPALLEQLARGGRMIVPVGEQDETQRLTLHEKSEDGTIRTKSGIPVRFVPMVHGEDR
jgi:protein-L-isoaspartate(D-aspartate) O-methyltransferase